MEIIDLNEENELAKTNEKDSDESKEIVKDSDVNKNDIGKNDLDKRDKATKKKHDDSKTPSPVREILSWFMYFVAAVAIALILKTFVIINATVPTGSMENTIMPDDCIMGFRLAYTFSEPKRGDIIIFKYPDDETQKYVKRIIGLPGDTVTIEDGEIYINGSATPYQESYLKEEWVVATGPYEFEVPEDSYLVLGDNRNNSSDARYWTNTYVSKDEIIGKAEFVYFPFSRLGVLK